MPGKIEALRQALPAGIDAAVIASEENRRYFTGFASSDGFLVVAREGAVFLTDSRYIEAARRTITECETRELKKLSEQLPLVMKRFSCRRVAVEASRLTVRRLRQFEEMLPDIEFCADNALDDAVNFLREVKSAWEVEQIKKAQRIAEDAFAHILTVIRPGVTERDLALTLDFTMRKAGAEDISFQTIAVSGPNSSMPHGVPGDRRIEPGDFVTMDFGALWAGYHSDMTRTVAVGRVSGEQGKVYETVLQAQKAALSALREGISCVQGDAAARDVIAAAGYGAQFGHGTGHGVGIEIHEEPRLSPSAKGDLRAGQIVTVEPGIYLPGQFGVRIEDMALVTASGCENLTNAPKELIVLE